MNCRRERKKHEKGDDGTGVGLMRKAFMFPRAWSSRFRPHNFHGTREGGAAGGEINLWAAREKSSFGDVSAMWFIAYIDGRAGEAVGTVLAAFPAASMCDESGSRIRKTAGL